MIINPNDMEFTAWAQAVAQQLGQQGDTITVNVEESWQEWAYKVLVLPQVSNQYAPRPGLFDDWRGWASAFNQCVRY